MRKTGLLFGAILLGLAACGVSPLDPTYISTQAASAADMVVAKKAARACALRDSQRARNMFLRYGFKVSTKTEKLRRGRTLERLIISAPTDHVTVLYAGSSCWVGLEGMTPAQSKELADVWVKAFEAKPNSAYGDGLSDHVSGAWRNFFTEPASIPTKAAYYHRIYIAAYKTWPQGPYDPQKNFGYELGEIFPKAPGAAVKLNHVIECRPQIVTGPASGAWLPCSGPTWRPKL